MHPTSTQQTFAKGSLTTEKCPSHLKTGKISSLVSKNYIFLPVKVELEQRYESLCVKQLCEVIDWNSGSIKRTCVSLYSCGLVCLCSSARDGASDLSQSKKCYPIAPFRVNKNIIINEISSEMTQWVIVLTANLMIDILSLTLPQQEITDSHKLATDTCIQATAYMHLYIPHVHTHHQRIKGCLF